MAIGWATKSDGLRVAWLIGVGLASGGVVLPPGPRSGRLLPYVSYVIVPLLLIGSAVTYGPELLAAFEQAGMDLYQESGQGDIRFTVLLNGSRALADRRWSAGALGRFPA